MLQQPAGLRCEGRYGAPILRWWSTGNLGVGFTRPSQQVGKKVDAIPRDKRGDLQDQVEGVRGGDSVRDSNSVV